MTGLRARIASWLLDLAVRIEPKVPPTRRSATNPARVVAMARLHGSPAELVSAAVTKTTADDLRRLASSVEDGHVTGFRVLWLGAPHRPETFYYVPGTIGEA